jgi:hypothetical protein
MKQKRKSLANCQAFSLENFSTALFFGKTIYLFLGKAASLFLGKTA